MSRGQKHVAFESDTDENANGDGFNDSDGESDVNSVIDVDEEVTSLPKEAGIEAYRKVSWFISQYIQIILTSF